MSLTPNSEDNLCLIPCSEERIITGQCFCSNKIVMNGVYSRMGEDSEDFLRRARHELKEYKHQQLMNDYNLLMMKIKVHLHLQDQSEHKIDLNRFPRPTMKEIDQLMNEVFNILREDSKSIRKY